MTQQVTRKDFDQYMIPTYAPASFIPVKAKGSVVVDQQGKEYIDFAGGIAVNVLGHTNDKLKQALNQQAESLWHIGNGYSNEPVLTLAKKLVESTFADKAFFCNSGAEANEAALKLARKYALDHHGAHKNEIVAFNSGFHGRTLFTVSAGGQPKYSQDFAPLPAGIRHIGFNDIEAAKATIGANTCAVIVEPIQGEGGVIPADREFLRSLRELCDQHDAVLIFDEVQTGVGRTGHLYAYMHYGIKPDVISTAKALGGGFPIAAMLTTDKFATTLSAGTHGTTYGGNPLAAAVANAVLDEVNQPEFLQGVTERNQLFLSQLNLINEKAAIFKEIRSMGLLIGCELNEQHQGQAKAISNIAAQEGLILLIAGPNVVRFAPALNVPKEDIETGLARFSSAINIYLNKD
ncbi:acetylornithine/succinylornithine family transaminase [Psychromonas sp. RZ22]|uniref:bifunctional succinylornithine transaminase/acetylornithine transaminase n=1 Tax=Psychromonas algarum TaxID=2555643 RepID=UPI001068347E|nr:bifunctional succinylornithine transaminase/acetylornithine transaminase [Psychromonas sp. RZ22]TEW54153.1 acetylornithine/succinylornithine family transaminase [Psychromonas sp. RZ22]